MGMSVDTLQNYKMLADMILELDELVSTGIEVTMQPLLMLCNGCLTFSLVDVIFHLLKD